jgi:hypothetical protein
MNHSLVTADRTTHLKIVVVSLIAAIVVVTVGVTARVTQSNTTTARIQVDTPVIKAGKAISITRGDDFTVR